MSKKLRAVKLPIVERKKCIKILNSDTDVTERMICAGYERKKKGACGGDSGSPLVYKNMVFGIDSWRVGKCGEFPDVFTSVKAIQPWIEKNTLIAPNKCRN